MRYALFAVLILYLITACRKNDTDLPPGTRLDSVTTWAASDNSVISGTKFNYDGTGNLAQCIVNNSRVTQFRYDAQNRLTNVSAYSNAYPAPSSGDTLVYSANRRIVYSYRYASGTTSLMASRSYVFDNNNRLIFDSTYFPNGIPFARYFFKYSYDAADNVQSVVVYGFNPNSLTGYTPQDSLVYTYDGQENPYYKYSFAIYTSNTGLSFSKHNLISSARFSVGSTQPYTVISYNSTYYKNGLLRTQSTNYGASSSIANGITAFSYR